MKAYLKIALVAAAVLFAYNNVAALRSVLGPKS